MIGLHPRTRDSCIAGFVAVLVILIIQQLADVTEFHYDSGQYWSLSEFRPFAEIPPGRRGYLYPLLLAPVNWLSQVMHGSKIPYRIASSLVYGIALSGFVTTFFLRVFKGEATVARRLVVPVLVALIFPGLLLYPLSDLPALLLIIAAISLAGGKRPSSVLHYAVIGALCYAAYNVRTIYLFPSLVLGTFLTLNARGAGCRAVAAALFLAGAGVLAVPQVLINNHLYGVNSPWVATFGKSSLMASQLRHGIAIDKYETSISPSDPSPQVVYLSPGGRAILESNRDFNVEPTVGKYLNIALHEPVYFLLAFLRHAIGGLDVRDGTVYVTVRSGDRDVWSAVHFAFLWLATVTMLLLVPWRSVKVLPIFLLLLPAILIIPGAVETRFLLPAHLVLYGCVASQFGFEEFGRQLKRRPLAGLGIADFMPRVLQYRRG
ncbi:hypothetical protein ACQKIE_13555 [Luteibacter sp. NPDC031894]|uniref:hypothetical protein n=1 Tax=Luteibacter sp. NPDC031894 TaxID=3390572 RepID=UPI003D04FC8B